MNNLFLDEYLNILNEDILNEGIFKDDAYKIIKLIQNYKLNLFFGEKFLKDAKIKIKNIKEDARNTGNFVIGMIKKKRSNESISNFIKDKTIKVVSKNLKEISSEIKESYKSHGILNIILIIIVLITVIYLNTTFFIIISNFMSQQAAFTVTAIICAPIVEEYAKRFAILKGFPYLYTTIFGVTEMMQYVGGMLIAGYHPIKSLMIRIMTLAMHYSTTILQKYYHDKSIILKDENKDRYDQNESMKGYIFSVAVHSMWNTMGTIFDKALQIWLKS